VENIRKLYIHRLIKELDFVKSDYDYKSELFVGANSEFIKDVNSFLENHPELKSLFEEKTNVSIIESESETLVQTEEFSDNSDVEKVTKDPKIKNLYRNIVKSTHPDKVNDLYLKELYIEATKAYDNNSLLSILTICDKLGIPYDLSEEEASLIKNEILSLNIKSQLLDNTYVFNWARCNTIEEKEIIILNYIKRQIDIF